METLSGPTVSSLLGIYSTCLESQESLSYLSRKLKLPVLTQPPKLCNANQFALELTDKGLQLSFTGNHAPSPVRVDFTSGASHHRRLYGGGKSQMIAKAIGIKSSFRPKVLDLTAGLGEDGFVMAGLGCTVTLLERVDWVFELLWDAWTRAMASENDELSSILERMTLVHKNAEDYLLKDTQLQEMPSKDAISFDVMYFDPMFPERIKTSKVKKKRVAFQQLIGGDFDAGKVFRLAFDSVNYRVVVKRPKLAPTLDQQFPGLNLIAPSFVLSGKSTRYDIYTKKSMGKIH